MAVEQKRIKAVSRKEVVLEFEGGDYAGARIVCGTDMSVDAYMAFTKDDTSAFDQLDQFAEQILRDWNLNDANDEPLEPTKAGMRAIPMDFALEIVKRWNEAVAVKGKEDAPLDKPSSNGAMASIPMTTLAGSLQS